MLAVLTGTPRVRVASSRLMRGFETARPLEAVAQVSFPSDLGGAPFEKTTVPGDRRPPRALGAEMRNELSAARRLNVVEHRLRDW
jgi:hypothetical protein